MQKLMQVVQAGAQAMAWAWAWAKAEACAFAGGLGQGLNQGYAGSLLLGCVWAGFVGWGGGFVGSSRLCFAILFRQIER